MDAEALYPSLDIEDIKESVWTLVNKSNIEFKHLDTQELVKFIAVMYTKDEQRKHQIISTIPDRQVELDGTNR